MRGDSQNAADRFTQRLRPATEEQGSPLPEKIPLFPSRVAEEYVAFTCHRRGMPGQQMMLRFHAKNAVDSFSIEYAHQQSIEFRQGPDVTTLVIHYYSGEEVSIQGRNLETLYLALTEHRVCWIHAIDEFTALAAGFGDQDGPNPDPEKTLVLGITIRWPNRPDPLVLASNDPFRLSADGCRPTIN